MKDKEFEIEEEMNEEALAAKSEKRKKMRNMVLVVLSVLIMASVCYGMYYYVDANLYFKTNNAKVTVKNYAISPATQGRLVKYTVSEGSAVKENEIIGRVENGSYLKSPVDGEVLKSNVTLNQMVSPATTVCVIGETGNIYVGVNIEETDIKKIKEGQTVKVQLDAYPGKTFKGHVSSIDPVTQTALSANQTSFTTSGTYTKTTQLIPIKVALDDDVDLSGIIGTNAAVKIKVK